MFSVIILDSDEFLNKNDTCIQFFLYLLLRHKFEKSLEIWLFSVFRDN